MSVMVLTGYPWRVMLVLDKDTDPLNAAVEVKVVRTGKKSNSLKIKLYGFQTFFKLEITKLIFVSPLR